LSAALMRSALAYGVSVKGAIEQVGHDADALSLVNHLINHSHRATIAP